MIRGAPVLPAIPIQYDSRTLAEAMRSISMAFRDLYNPVTYKKESRIEVLRTKKGAAAPTEALRAAGASGAVFIPVFQFSKTVQQDVYFEFHTPTECISNSAAEFHLMWLPGAAWTTGNYLWKLEYLVKSEYDTAINTGTPTTISMSVTPANAVNIVETHFTSTITVSPNQVIMCHFYRDVAGDNGDDVGEVRFFEIEYMADKLGEAL